MGLSPTPTLHWVKALWPLTPVTLGTSHLKREPLDQNSPVQVSCMDPMVPLKDHMKHTSTVYCRLLVTNLINHYLCLEGVHVPCIYFVYKLCVKIKIMEKINLTQTYETSHFTKYFMYDWIMSMCMRMNMFIFIQ